MAKLPRTRKNRNVRRLNVEQLEARRVFAGIAFESVEVIPQSAVKAVVTDSLGNSYITGEFAGTVDFDTDAQHPSDHDILTARGANDVFVLKLDPNNEFVWVNRLGGDSLETSSLSTDRASAIRVDDSGNVWLTGTFGESADVGGTVLVSDGGRDVFVTKLDASGTFLWADRFGGIENDAAVLEFALDAESNTTVGGRSSGANTSLFLRQYDTAGNLNWSHESSSIGRSSIDRVTGDELGNIYVGGGFLGNFDADFTSGEDLFAGAGQTELATRNEFISRYGSDGTYQWTTALISSGDKSNVTTFDFTIDDSGDLALVGYQQNGSVSIAYSDNKVPQEVLTESIEYRIFFLKLGGNGELKNANPYWTISEAGALDKIVATPSGYVATARIKNSGSFSPAPGITISGYGASTESIGGTALTTILLEMNADGQIIDAGRIGGFASASFQSTLPIDLYRNPSGKISLLGRSASSEIDYDPSLNAVSDVKSPGNFLLTLRETKAGDQVTRLKDDFEFSNWTTIWTQDSQNDWFRSTQRATKGSYSAEVDGSASNATLTTANGIDLTGLDSATLTFDWLIESGFDSGEFLSLDVSTNGGATWIQDVRRLNGNVSAENVWRSETVDMSPYMTANTKIRFRSTVSASDEDANVDNVLITGVVAGPNTAPIANAGSGYTMNEGGSVTLSGAASSDPDGSIATYAWDLDLDGQYDDATGVSPTFSTTNSGTFTVGLLVTDNRGATSTATTTVVVNNVAPTANAGNDLTGLVNQSIQLNASGSSDPGNDIVSYLWDLNNDGVFGDAAGSQVAFSSAIAGVFAVGLQVIDADGAVGHDSLTITISAAPVLSTKFYVVDDAGTDRTFEYTANGTSVENYSLGSGNTAPRGAASTVAGDKVWVVDANKMVYIYNAEGALLGSWLAGSLASNATIEGITTNGADVWLVDARQDRVYRYTGAASRLSGSQNAASSFALNSGNRDPKDLVTDGSHIWVVNSTTTDRVFKYTVTGSLVGNWTIDSANSSPTGITLDPSGASQSLWIVDNGTDRVYEYTNARGRNSGSQSAANSFALGAGNSNPQGIADPPVASVNQQAVSAPMVIGAWSTQSEQRPVNTNSRYAAVDRAMASGLLDYSSFPAGQASAGRGSTAPTAAEQRVWSEYTSDLEQDEWDDALSQAIDELVVSVG